MRYDTALIFSTMMHKYDPLVERLEGLKAWCIKTSMAGMTIQFGKDQGIAAPHERGEWTVFVRCGMTIAAAGKRVLTTDYSLEELERTVCQYIDGQVVTRAGIDDTNNSLRVLFGTDTLLSIYPGTAQDGPEWILFDNCSPQRARLIVHSDCFRGELAGTE